MDLSFLTEDDFAEANWSLIADLEGKPKEFVVDYINTIAEELAGYLNVCESPIEQLMAIALTKQSKVFSTMTGIDVFFNVQDQLEVEDEKKYRVDFFIVCTARKRHYGFVIECDGHDFHEKTKEQAAKDKTRDRALLKKGHMVIRFTGSEIWENPLGCAREVFRIILSFIKEYK